MRHDTRLRPYGSPRLFLSLLAAAIIIIIIFAFIT